MSQINFESLTRERPDLDAVWAFLRSWLSAHPEVIAISIERLARAAESPPASRLAEGLEILCRGGFLREVYRVKDLDHTFLAGEYDSPDKVPDRVLDRLNEDYVDTSERDIVPVYRLKEAAANGMR